MKTEAGYAVAARLTVERASTMTPKGRRSVAKWMMACALDLLRDGEDYSARHVARYWYRVGKRAR